MLYELSRYFYNNIYFVIKRIVYIHISKQQEFLVL